MGKGGSSKRLRVRTHDYASAAKSRFEFADERRGTFPRRGRNPCSADKKDHLGASMNRNKENASIRQNFFRRLFALALGLAAMACAGCGSGPGSSPSPTPTPAPTLTSIAVTPSQPDIA